MRKMFRGFPCKGEKRLVQRKPTVSSRIMRPPSPLLCLASALQTCYYSPTLTCPERQVILVSVFNQCTFIGHAGSDAKLLTTSAGRPFLKFRLGVSDYSGKDEDTLWLTVLVWSSKQTETLGNLVKKGALVLVAGRLSVRPYVNSEGVEKTEVEVIAQDVQILARPKLTAANGQADKPVSDEAQAG